MKKKYSKPYFFIETFRLSASISACGGVGNGALGETHASDPNSCAWTTPWGQVFFATEQHCGDGIVTDPGNVEIGCYYTGADEKQIFGSS